MAMQEKLLKQEVIANFLDDDWLHPIFVPKVKKVFKRISGPIAFDLDDPEETLTESLVSQLPNARYSLLTSIVGGVSHFQALKSKKSTQGRGVLSQSKPADLHLVAVNSQADFKRFTLVEQFSKTAKQESPAPAASANINALTAFATTPAPAPKSDSQETLVAELRAKKKAEVDAAVEQRELAAAALAKTRALLAEAAEEIARLTKEQADLGATIADTARELKAKDLVAGSLGGLDERQAQVSAASAEVEELEKEWAEAEDELQQGLAKARRQFEEKRAEVEMKQEKIEFFESNYSKLVQELKAETAKRESLIQEYKNMAKDLKREYLAQLIDSTKERCKESEASTLAKLNELKALSGAIAKIEDEVKYLTADIVVRIGEGEDKKKKDNKSFDKLRAAFDGLAKIFTQTKHYMEKFADLRAKNKQLHDRVMELKRAKYQEISEKLKRDLGDLASFK